MHRLAIAFGVLCACQPELPLPGGGHGAGTTEADVSFSIEPESPLDATPRALRIRLGGAGSRDIDPSSVVLVEGGLGEYQLRDLTDGELSKTLTERILPATTYAADDGSVLLIPHFLLTPASDYAVGYPGLEEAFTFAVDPSAALPLLQIWPGPQASAFALFCGDAELPPLDRKETRLDPDGPRGTLALGSPGGHATRCVRFDPGEGPVEHGVFHAPVAPGAGFLLDQAPITVADTEPDPIDVVACEQGEVPFGRGCARVMDDRAVVRAPEAALLWVVTPAGAPSTVEVTRDGSSFTVRGLEPSQTVDIAVETLSAAGWQLEDVKAHTLPPAPHFVINEVLANAVGEEPEQEWVEIVNDGSVAGLLDGTALEDIGGHTVFPAGSGWLEPGAFVVLVGAAFDDESRYDVQPDPSALLVRAEGTLGKNGLSNSGEPLKLVGLAGEVLSRFPSEPKPSKPGHSVARSSPAALDDDPAAFQLVEMPTPGLGNAE